MKKVGKLIFLVVVALSFGVFVACSDGDEGSSSSSPESSEVSQGDKNDTETGSSKETLVTKYSYNLTSNNDYYIVHEFHCVDNGDKTYDVREYYRHFFRNTDEAYKGKTGDELIKLVKAKSVTATSTKTGTQQKAVSSTAKNSSGEITATYNIPEGLSFNIYYYGEEPLVTKYTYDITSNNDYYIVDEFHCVDNGDKTYDVKGAYRHFFKNTNENYKDKTGNDIINLVKAKSVTATNTKTSTQPKTVSLNAKNSSGEITATYNIPEGLTYIIYYYE